MLKEGERKRIYSEYLRRLWKGDYLTRARRGLLSELGARRFDRKMEEEGFLKFSLKKAGIKKALFLPKGINYLIEIGVLDKNFGGYDDI